MQRGHSARALRGSWLRGVKQAALINTVVTFAKVIPITVFVIIFLFVFKYGTFHLNIQSATQEGGLIQQFAT